MISKQTFKAGIRYYLVDFDGFAKEQFCCVLANFIKLTGGWISPVHESVDGCAVGLRFANGVIDLSEYIDIDHIKYFSDSNIPAINYRQPLPKPFNRGLVDNIVQFPPLTGIPLVNQLYPMSA